MEPLMHNIRVQLEQQRNDIKQEAIKEHTTVIRKEIVRDLAERIERHYKALLAELRGEDGVTEQVEVEEIVVVTEPAAPKKKKKRGRPSKSEAKLGVKKTGTKTRTGRLATKLKRLETETSDTESNSSDSDEVLWDEDYGPAAKRQKTK